MREIRTSGSMSGAGKRGDASFVPAPILDSTENCAFLCYKVVSTPSPAQSPTLCSCQSSPNFLPLDVRRELGGALVCHTHAPI
jgi:hypothetical protein